MQIFKLGYLKQALITFDHNGRSGQRGSWSVVNGGYDLWFEISYNGMPIVDCVDGELERLTSDLSIEDFDDICSVVQSVIPGLTILKSYGYEIVCRKETDNYLADTPVADNDDVYFPTEEEAIEDAEMQIENLLEWDEYADCTYSDFDINVIRVK